MEFRLIQKGLLKSAWSSDINLLETTTLSVAEQYISEGGLEKDIQSYRDGTLIKQQMKKDKIAMQPIAKETEEMKKIDAEILKSIMRMRSFVLNPDEKAADFLERLKYLFSKPEKLKEMGECAKIFSRPQSAKIIAEYIVEYLTK